MRPTMTTPEHTQRGETGKRAAAGGGLAALVIVAGVALHAPSLGRGFAYDDYFHQCVLRGLGPARTPVWSLYDFGPHAGRDAPEWNFAAWWADPGFKVRFFRPVTSVTLMLDHALYGSWAPGYHLTNLTLFAVFLALVLRLYRRLGLSATTQRWGMLLAAFASAHAVPVDWIANRNTLLAGLFTVATLLAADRAARDRRAVWFLVTAAAFLAGCGSKESGLAAFPLVLLYLALSGVARPVATQEPGRARPRRWAVVWLLAGLTIAYLAFYITLGYGARSDLYPTPWADPGAYVVRLSALLPLALAGLLWGAPLDLFAVQPGYVWPAAALALVVSGGAAAVYLRVVRRSPVMLFGLGCIVIAVAVESGGDFSARLLSGAAVGAGVLFGVFFDALGSWRRARDARQWPRLVLGGLLIAGGPVSSLVQSTLGGVFLGALARDDRRAIASAPIDRTLPPPRRVVLLNAPSALLGLSFAPTWSVLHDDRDTTVFPLQFGGRGLRLSRPDEHTLLVESLGTPFGDNRIERLFRYRRPMGGGDVFSTPAFTAMVISAEPRGARRVRFRFGRPLDDPTLTLLAFQEGRFVRYAPPAVGETVNLPGVPRAAWFAP